MATLSTGGYGFGRFYASYGTLDPDGEPDREFANEYIDWSGVEVLVPQSHPQPSVG
ncbi:hypothetical protein [Micromonospora craniellae]|uniref:hypothetical protein n=1 Tax=Micromonospora craniellae TaxID=2294034 RepID=UPI0013144BEC|nr:hypothetical protein [Micromonospora craniellae]QOC89805.1 hypothetical protein ID554_16280 [Micromonospora craniellae]